MVLIPKSYKLCNKHRTKSSHLYDVPAMMYNTIQIYFIDTKEIQITNTDVPLKTIGFERSVIIIRYP